MEDGKRIFLKRELPDAAVIKAYTELPSSNVADCMNRTGAMSPRIRLMSKPKKEMCGPAFTVHNRPGDNLTIFAALKYCHPGDVVVIDNEGDNTRAVIGEVMMTWLRDQRHVAGVVVDGPMRDIDTLRDWDLPIYAVSTTPNGPYKEGPGEINVPISCGNTSVYPGDIILGDADGVVRVGREDAAELLPKVQAFHKKDDAKAASYHDGTGNLDWVDVELANKGYKIIDDTYRL
ncbi:RraA family protein [Lactobacillus sp. ESL0731]|uniref:RraA family protein n=1 Tax=unclassified Lactobacillus TaxID=2620435 RepID=UPI0023F6EEEA|nr:MULTISPECIES: RraA family protein [unclassified Lactobacillus]WEV50357.1 RraA family protein [Lactobacillus sp. ESL0700]WEV61486.1 RraA family protein [Lactobacillus sp. ESL0731]